MGELTENRLRELADRSYKNNSYTFTEFLSLSEQETFFGIERELGYAKPVLFGGSEENERRVLRFGDPASLGYEEPFPVTCLLAEPLILKFSDALNHRDFLGALMNLGIERALVGDIRVKENCAVIFCLDRIAEYICENLTRVRRTSIKVSLKEEIPERFRPEFEKVRITVGSERLDSAVAAVFHLSRTRSLELFREKEGRGIREDHREQQRSLQGRGCYFRARAREIPGRAHRRDDCPRKDRDLCSVV